MKQRLLLDRLGLGGQFPFLLFRKQGFHDVLEFVRTLHILRIVVNTDVKRKTMLGSNRLKLFLEPEGYALGIQRVGFGQDDGKEFWREVVNRIRGPEFARHSFGGFTPSGFALLRILIA